MAFKPRRNKQLVVRLHQAVARQIGTAIVSGTIKPGDSLDSEIAQAETLGVSRTAYREAIRILVAKGLLESRPKAGTHVTERRRWNKLDPDVLEWSFADKPDPQFVRDLFELRQVVEPAAAGLAAVRLTPAGLAEMDRQLALMHHFGLGDDRGQAADRDFHAALLSASGNEVLESLASSIGAAVRWTTHFKQRIGRMARDSLPDHVELRDAIASRNSEAAKAAMTRLLTLALADMSEPE